MEYIYKENQKGAPVFVLLHGTGGTENDLLPLAQVMEPSYNVLSIRGEVKENGMNRYFRRLGEGNYDWDDLEKRSEDLVNFIKEKATEYEFSTKDVIFVGFSNGSNIAIHMMLNHPDKFKKAMLFAPLYPKNIESEIDFSQAEVFLSLGKGDPIVPESESEHVIDIFKKNNADVTTIWVNGHSLPGEAVEAGRQWINR